MTSDKKPENFNSVFEVVSCFLQNEGKFLILHRKEYKPQGNTWCLASGKVDLGENKEEAIIREIFEETGHIVDSNKLNHFKELYVRYSEYDFIYHIFHLPIEQKFDVKLEERSHKDFKWVTPEEALQFNLIQDLDECIKLFYGIK